MTDTGRAALLGAPFQQCAVVVEDLDDAVRHWHGELGVGPWTAFRYGPPLLKEMRYRGADAEFSLRHALCWQGEVQLELVQPLAGPSIFADHLAAHGPGLHHLGKYVADHAAAVGEALAAGFEPLQSARGFGAEGDGAFAYFQPPGMALVVELIAAPRVRIEPEFVYPPAPGTAAGR
jgi:methylmalonyl-CoA/ethylmalonyl-CoA epimerase